MVSFVIVVLNIVFLFKRGNFDCKLHSTIDWKDFFDFFFKTCQSLHAVLFCFSKTPQINSSSSSNACECIFLLAGFTCDVLVLLPVRFVSSCLEVCGEGEK